MRIKEGYCYQVMDQLLNVTTKSTANMLTKLAATKGAFEIGKDAALDRGFEELSTWSIPEHDQLYIIGNYILVCIPKDGGAYV